MKNTENDMKLTKLYTLILSCFLALPFASNAQMASGSLAPNFVATDIEGNEYELYDLLSQGYKVIIDVSATWCGPCWDYHQQGALKDIWNQYGPDGSQEIFVIFIEGDDSTTSDDLNGVGGTWNWVEGTPYPMFDDAGYVANLLEIAYYPTVYTVCSDGLIYETGQISAAQHYSFATELDCQAKVNDQGLSSSRSLIGSCDEDIQTEVQLINFGTDELSTATIELTGCDNCPLQQTWEGSLGYFENESIVFEDVQMSDDGRLSYSIDVDDEISANNDVIQEYIIGGVEASTSISISLKTDCWPGETSWVIEDADGNVVERSPLYSEQNTEYNHFFVLPGTGCYNIVLSDSYGDGFNGSAYPDCGQDGFFNCTTDVGDIIIEDGSNQFSSMLEVINASSTTSVTETGTMQLDVFPNPATDNITIELRDLDASNIQFEIFSMDGKELLDVAKQVNASDFTFNMNINSLSAGLYYLIVTDDQNRSLHKKLVVE